MAFDRLGIDYEMVGISEIDKYALQSYMEIHGETKNFGSICDIRGSDLPQIDVFTWSFPCTDLSRAGSQKGLQGGTRSGLVYEVLRILHECDEIGNKPTVLIMENVVDLVQTKFIREFNEIQLELEQLGYKNYVDTLNSKDYGVAQNRDRVFMVSILGEYYYEFPKPFKLEKRLKNYLEEKVDDKYYLSKAMLNYCMDMKDRNGFAITTNPGSRPVDNFILESDDSFVAKKYQSFVEKNGYIPNMFNPYNEQEIEDVSPTMTANCSNNCTSAAVLIKETNEPFLRIPEDTIKGYTEAFEGDGVYINRPHQKRGVVQNGMIQTLKTSGSDVGVVVPFGSYYTWEYKQGNINTQCNRAADEDGYALTVACAETGKVFENNLRIRKLMPIEVWRLMGIDDECFYKAQKVCSNAQLYKQAGNGIVVDIFAQIVGMMLERK